MPAVDQTSQLRRMLAALQEQRGSDSRGSASPPPAPSPHPFTAQARRIRDSIEQLQTWLLEQRSTYIAVGPGIGDVSMAPTLSLDDSVADQIDTEAQAFLKRCDQAIQDLQEFLTKSSTEDRSAVATSLFRHQTGVLEILRAQLRGVAEMYSLQREARMQSAQRRLNMLRAGPVEVEGRTPRRSLRRRRTAAAPSNERETVVGEQETPAELAAASRAGVRDEEDVGAASVNVTAVAATNTRSGLRLAVPPVSASPAAPEAPISKAMEEVLQQENQTMLEELHSLGDDIKEAEQKIREIARLNALLATNLGQQAEQIERICTDAADATANIDAGNEEIKKASDYNRDFRWGVLFFLLMLSFALLFLDWHGRRRW